MIGLSAAEVTKIAVHGFGAMQKPEEFCALLERVITYDSPSILEIGVGRGGTSWAWSKVCGQLVSIDLPGGPWGGGPSKESLEYISAYSSAPFFFLPGNSQSEQVFEAAKEKGPYDFLFIDGDHSYEGVKADYERYAPLVRAGGLIAFHDICKHEPASGCEVERFWKEVSQNRDSFTHISEPSNWGGIGGVFK